MFYFKAYYFKASFFSSAYMAGQAAASGAVDWIVRHRRRSR